EHDTAVAVGGDLERHALGGGEDAPCAVLVDSDEATAVGRDDAVLGRHRGGELARRPRSCRRPCRWPRSVRATGYGRDPRPPPGSGSLARPRRKPGCSRRDWSERAVW